MIITLLKNDGALAGLCYFIFFRSRGVAFAWLCHPFRAKLGFISEKLHLYLAYKLKASEVIKTCISIGYFTTSNTIVMFGRFLTGPIL
jgi:hypothetical protein